MAGDAVITTPRLWLRPHAPEDAAFMVELSNNSQVTRYTGDGPLSLADAQAILASLQDQYATQRAGRFMVVERATGARLGFAGCKWDQDVRSFDLGYRLAPHAWGRGLATEAAAACVHYAWTVLGVDQLVAQVMEENVASQRVLQKLGFQRAPHLGPEMWWCVRAVAHGDGSGPKVVP